MDEELYINANGKKVKLSDLPCIKCSDRYSIHCPSCNWNKDGKINTYASYESNRSYEQEREVTNGEESRHEQ